MSSRDSLTVVGRAGQQLAQTLKYSHIGVFSAVSHNHYEAQQMGIHSGPDGIEGRQHLSFPTVEVAGYGQHSLRPLLGGAWR